MIRCPSCLALAATWELPIITVPSLKSETSPLTNLGLGGVMIGMDSSCFSFGQRGNENRCCYYYYFGGRPVGFLIHGCRHLDEVQVSARLANSIRRIRDRMQCDTSSKQHVTINRQHDAVLQCCSSSFSSGSPASSSPGSCTKYQ